MALVPPFDLKFLTEFAASAAGTSNRRHEPARHRVRESRGDGLRLSAYHPHHIRTARRAAMYCRFLSVLGALLITVQAAQAQDITLRYGQNAAGTGGLSSLPLNVALRKDYFHR